MPKLWSGPSHEVYLSIHYKRYTDLKRTWLISQIYLKTYITYHHLKDTQEKLIRIVSFGESSKSRSWRGRKRTSSSRDTSVRTWDFGNRGLWLRGKWPHKQTTEWHKVLVKVVVSRTVRDSNRVASKRFREKMLTFPLFIVTFRSNMATVVCYRRAQAFTWKRLEHRRTVTFYFCAQIFILTSHIFQMCKSI